MSSFQPIPVEDTAETNGLLQRAKTRLSLAALLSAALLLIGAPWESISPFGAPFLLIGLVDPASGFFVLTGALWLLFTVPGMLHTLARRRPREGVADKVKTASRSTDAEGRRRLRIPAGGLEDIGAEHRWELAAALDIPWRDELIHDHQSWAIACREAAQHRAARPFD